MYIMFKTFITFSERMHADENTIVKYASANLTPHLID